MTEIAESRLSVARWGSGQIAVVSVGLVWIVLAAFWAAPAPFTVDGYVYRAMIDAIARNGSLFLDNGYATYRSEALAPMYAVISGDQLAPQYPGGWGILAAPAYMAAGVRGVMLVNAVASALTLPMIWIAAEALFRDRRVAVTAALIYALATFSVEYAVGFWPHAVTTFLVTAAFAATAHGWRGNDRDELRGFLFAGLAIGVAVNIRVDAILAAFAIATWLMGAARRPYAGLAMLLLGLAPGLAAATWINYAKFDRLSPVTYGKSSGGASIRNYAELLPLLAVGGLAALALGLERIRATVLRPAGIAAILAGLAAAVLSVPYLGALAWRLAHGAYVLVVDFQSVPFPGRGLFLTDYGTITAWGLFKKALLESLPYAAAVVVLTPGLLRGPNRAGLVLCLLFMLPFIAFFSLNTWHGGGSSNMRYFLNFMPVLAILSAMALHEISACADDRSWPALVGLLGVGGGAIVYAHWKGYPPAFLVQHTLPMAVVIGLAGLSILLAVTHGGLRATVARTMLGLFMLGLATAASVGWGLDLAASQQTRARNAEIAEHTRDLPANALLVTEALEASGFRMNRPPALTAHADFRHPELSPDLTGLVERAFAEGRPVFVQGRHVAERFVAAGAATGLSPRYGIAERFELYRLTPPGSEDAPR